MSHCLKKLFLSFCFYLGFLCLGFGQSKIDKNDTSFNRKEYYSKFIDKPVYELLLDDSVRSYINLKLSSDPPGMLNCSWIKINKKEYIQIFVCKYDYVTQFNEFLKWDKNLYYKEKICRIVFYKNDIIELDIKQSGL